MKPEIPTIVAQPRPATTAKTLLLVGATSDIGHATALVYAQQGWRIILAGRNQSEVERNAADIGARTQAIVTALRLDILETDRFAAFINGLPALPDTVVCVVGELGVQQQAETDLAHAALLLRTNFEGPALFLGVVADRFAARGSGAIAGVSSVAGDRGRGSNYVYGSAKAGLTAFLSGLRNRMNAKGVRVVTVKPGFVATRMTATMKLPAALTAAPEEVARTIFAAAEVSYRGTVYVRPVWRLIMGIITAIPDPIFRRMKL